MKKYPVSLNTFDGNSKIHLRVADEDNLPVFTRQYDWQQLDLAIEVMKALVEFQKGLP